MRALIVDDEELARERLRALLADLPDVEAVGEARDGEDALHAVAALRPDAVFLDIQMPGADGLEVVRSMAAPRPKIVFCTGHDQYAIDAFELNAVDYLLKPVSRPRLARTVERLRRTAAEAWDAGVERAAQAGRFGAGRLLVRSGARFRVLAQDEVAWLSADTGTAVLHAAGARYDLQVTLAEIERRLEPGRFFRVSRAALVRLDAIAEVAPAAGGGGEVRLRAGTRGPVRRRRLGELLERLQGPGR